jgi:GMP synthase-like glutamine amidotransferase
VSVLILQHQDDAPAGLLLDALRDAGLRWQIAHLDRGEALPPPAGIEIAITLGSETAADDPDIDWIGAELDWLRAADASGTAILGVCFGAQAMSVALGGGVDRATRPELGWVEISTDAPELIASGPWLSWHNDILFPPPGSEVLAHNESGTQAFRLGRHLGVQFHPEVTEEIVEAWIRTSTLDDAAAEELRAETSRAAAPAAVNARRLFTGFVQGRW